MSAALILVASAGLVALPQHIAALNAAAVRSCPVHVVAPAGITLDQLLQPTQAQADELLQPQQAGLTPQASEILRSAWEARVVTSSNDSRNVVAAIGTRLGLPDAQVAKLPASVLKSMAVDKALCMPDLVHLNAAKLTHLKLPLVNQQQVASDGDESGGSGKTGQSGFELTSLLTVLQGNTTLTALTLKGLCIIGSLYGNPSPTLSHFFSVSSQPLCLVTFVF